MTAGRALGYAAAFFGLLAAGLPSTARAATPARPQWIVKRTIPLGRAWAGHPVGFAFKTRGQDQYVGWYDQNRVMTFAQRKLSSDKWTLQRLKSRVGWDSHNYITLAFDRAGGLHVSGNLHCNPLTYWHSQKPGDVTSLKPIHKMTGKNERGCTYPTFFTGVGSRLFFMYREGSSGNGRRFVNAYDVKAKTWKRFLSTPLFQGRSGGKTMNAYPVGMTTGPDGVFHIVWVWRDTSNCATNHDLSYARTRDFKTWTTSSGKPLKLPLTLRTAEIVDPVRTNGGLMNWGNRLSFDPAGRVLITYSRFDARGKNQLYAARLEKNGWKIHQLTAWKHRWHFKGGGCISSEISWDRLRPTDDGKQLRVTFRHPEHKGGRFEQRFDPQTLKPIAPAKPLRSPWPKELTKVRSAFPGMKVHLRASPPIKREGATMRYLLRWETMPVNRDRSRKKYPKPGPIEVIELKKK
jgi:BNR repeat-containing family member